MDDRLTHENKAAIAENLMDLIKKGNLADTEVILEETSNSEIWCNLLRYELLIDYLTWTGRPLQFDVILPRLANICPTVSTFHYAALCGADGVLRKALRFGMPVDACLGNGSTALHLACFGGMLDTVRMLINEFHADVRKTDRYLWGPLHYASTAGHLAVVNFLLELTPDAVTRRDKDGTTAAYRARECGHSIVVEKLICISKDPDILLISNDDDDGQNRMAPIEPVYSISRKIKRSLRKKEESQELGKSAQNESSEYLKTEIRNGKVVILPKVEEITDLDSRRTTDYFSSVEVLNKSGSEEHTKNEKARKLIRSELEKLRQMMSSDGETMTGPIYEEIWLMNSDEMDNPYAVPRNCQNNEESISLVTLKHLLQEEFSDFVTNKHKRKSFGRKDLNGQLSNFSVGHSAIYEEILSVIRTLPRSPLPLTPASDDLNEKFLESEARSIPLMKSRSFGLGESRSVQSDVKEQKNIARRSSSHNLDGSSIGTDAQTITIVGNERAQDSQGKRDGVVILNNPPYYTGNSSFYA